MNLDIGVIRRIETAGRPAPSTIVAMEGFAGAMTARYASRSTLASHVDLALAQVGHPEFNYFQGPQRIEAFPQIDVHIEQRLDGARMDLARPAPAVGFGEADAMSLYRRLLSRRERLPTFPTLVDASGPDHLKPGNRIQSFGAPLAQVGRAERALPKAMTMAPMAQPTAGDRQVTQASFEEEWGTPPRIPAEPKTIKLPAVEIRRVAEHVIRELDHRAVARRERMGGR